MMYHFILVSDIENGNQRKFYPSSHRMVISDSCHIISEHQILYPFLFMSSIRSLLKSCLVVKLTYSWVRNKLILKQSVSDDDFLQLILMNHLFCYYTPSSLIQVEQVQVEISMPKTVLNVNLTCNMGKYTFDPTSKILLWDVGRMEPGKQLPTVRGNIILQSGSPLPDSNPTILLRFTINQLAISGVKVNRLDMYEEVSSIVKHYYCFIHALNNNS